MALTALTTLTHGNEAGERTVVPEGDKVPPNVFSKDELQALKDQGLVGEPPVPAADAADVEAENEDLKAKVAALQAELAAAKAPSK